MSVTLSRNGRDSYAWFDVRSDRNEQHDTAMKKIWIGLVTALLGALLGFAVVSYVMSHPLFFERALFDATAKDWLTDMPKALAKAEQEKKRVLVDFTGSDWCVWCVRFKKDVLSTQAFADYARKNLVLVELDFPLPGKAPDDALAAAKMELQRKYEVTGFPTLLLLDSSGKEVWRQVGYLEGGPQAFIAALEKAKK